MNKLYTIISGPDNLSGGGDLPAASALPAASGLPGGVGFTVRMNPEHVIYSAHFPGDPITPGVCIIQMGVELLGRALGRPLELSAVKNVKFLSILRPDGIPVAVSIRKIALEPAAPSASISESTPAAIPASISESAPADPSASVPAARSNESSDTVSAILEFSKAGEPVAKMSLICRKRSATGDSAAQEHNL